MSSNSNNPAENSNSDDFTELIIASVALVISVAAFIIAILQALQQYFSSARGYSSCSRDIIGGWAQWRHRRLRWSEFRFEVQFSVPIIFVARPENKLAPLDIAEGGAILHVDGTDDSLDNTHIPKEMFEPKQANDSSKHNHLRGLHTAKNEEATWLALLAAIQRMERESYSWQDQQLKEPRNTPGISTSVSKLDSANQSKATHARSLVVCMQRKPMSWDSMPDGVIKPYAITTISHLVEFTAMLGIYWKEFNLNEHRYRAQGNGFNLEGSYIESLGVTFTFQKTAPTWFMENRVVPSHDMKELCFGLAPTIFRRHDEELYADEPMGDGTLRLGSMAEIADTLAVFGCNTTTVDYFRKASESTRHGHIFPVPFEILGMIGIVFQVEDTIFRMLPNPTVFTWTTTELSLIAMLRDFRGFFESLQLKKDNSLDQAHVSLLDKILVGMQTFDNENKDRLKSYKNGAVAFDIDILRALHHSIKFCDAYLSDPKRKRFVRSVLRAHIQEVLALANTTGYAEEMDSINVDSLPHKLVEDYWLQLRPGVSKAVLRWEKSLTNQGPVSEAQRPTSNSGADPEQVFQGIWGVLVIRMLCWLLLHDFHPKDLQISKSGVFNSRRPVFIV
ncbi:hypothetical protein GQ53DRAFT_889219 [Thozetella sp. PMI_491]|nr:hypothetical protein GQ53DRAFT_889219 [Thozetella sp. PMI_491]